MTAVITVQAHTTLVGDGKDAGATIAAAIAQRLTGPCVVVPFEALHRDWVAKPHRAEIDVRVAAQQLKLLSAGYVKAGYHVVVHGEALASGDARDGLLRLIRMVPGVYALAVGVGVGVGVDVAVAVELALSAEQPIDAIAQAVWEALPPDAVSGRGDG
jgi:hypothetical protein